MKLWQIIVSFQDILVSPLDWRQICGSRKKGQIEIATVVTLCEGAHQCCEQTTVLSTFLHRKKLNKFTHIVKKNANCTNIQQKIVTVVTLELSVKEPICAVCFSIWNIWIWIKFLSFNGPYQPIVQQMIDLIKANLSQVHLTSDVFFQEYPFQHSRKNSARQNFHLYI